MWYRKITATDRGQGGKKNKITWWPTLPKETLHLGARVAQCDTKTWEGCSTPLSFSPKNWDTTEAKRKCASFDFYFQHALESSLFLPSVARQHHLSSATKGKKTREGGGRTSQEKKDIKRWWWHCVPFAHKYQKEGGGKRTRKFREAKMCLNMVAALWTIWQHRKEAARTKQEQLAHVHKEEWGIRDEANNNTRLSPCNDGL